MKVYDNIIPFEFLFDLQLDLIELRNLQHMLFVLLCSLNDVPFKISHGFPFQFRSIVIVLVPGLTLNNLRFWQLTFIGIQILSLFRFHRIKLSGIIDGQGHIFCILGVIIGILHVDLNVLLLFDVDGFWGSVWLSLRLGRSDCVRVRRRKQLLLGADVPAQAYEVIQMVVLLRIILVIIVLRIPRNLEFCWWIGHMIHQDHWLRRGFDHFFTLYKLQFNNLELKLF